MNREALIQMLRSGVPCATIADEIDRHYGEMLYPGIPLQILAKVQADKDLAHRMLKEAMLTMAVGR